MRTTTFSFLVLMAFNCWGQTLFKEVTTIEAIHTMRPDSPWGSGVSAADYDNDGDPDIFLCSAAPSPNLLLINNGNGTFRVERFEKSWNAVAALWLDYNGDRQMDLFVAGNCPYGSQDCQTGSYWALYRNFSNGTFEDVTENAGLSKYHGPEMNDVGGLSAGDINLDGFLDIVITYWGGPVTVYINKGDGTFEHASDLLDTDEQEVYWQPLIYDLDQDGWPEIYLAVDYTTPNQLWKQSGDMQFKDIAPTVGLDSKCEDMGLAMSDVENDGDLDLYITCRSFEAGKVLSPLFINDGFKFTNQSEVAGVGKSGWAWGVTFFDANNDSFQDLALTNGVINTQGEQSKFWLNSGNGTFTDRSAQVQFNDTYNGTTLVSLDYDRDGDLDLIQSLKSDADVPVRLLENQLEKYEKGNYVIIQPRMNGTNHWAIGSSVKISYGDQVQIKPITAGISFYGQEPSEAFFGLGNTDTIDQVEVIWPGGGTTIRYNVTANQILKITDYEALHPPHLKNIHYQSEGALELSWINLCTYTQTVIEYSTSPLFDRPSSLTVSQPASSVSIENLIAGQTYYFRLRALRDEETSINSAVLSGTAPAAMLLPPTDLKLKVLSENSIGIEWTDKSEFETGYDVERSLSEEFSEYLTFEIAPNSTSMVHHFLQPGFKYYFRVRAKSKNWHSAYSETISITMNYILHTTAERPVDLYPNPANETVFLPCTTYPCEVNIYNISGQLIRQELVPHGEFRHKLPPGQYILSIWNHQGQHLMKRLSVK